MDEAAARYPASRSVDVTVDYVRFLGDDEAEVHFVLFHGRLGNAGMHQVGHAVRVGDTWKVSRDTWCGLVAMAGVQCPRPEPDDG